MEVFSVFATLGLDSANFQSGLDSAENKLKNTSQTFGKAGQAMTTHVSAPLIAIGIGALKVGADFEAGMNQVAAVSGATGDDMERLREQAKELGATTQFSATDAAEAMNFMAMAGMSVDEILTAMPDTLQLAAAAQMDMGEAADTVTNILSGYGIEVADLEHATDVLVETFTSANTDLSGLGEAMKYVGPIASAAGVSFEESAAAIGMMGNAGIQGSSAGTALRGAISRMLNPTEKVSEMIAGLGLSTEEAAEMMDVMGGASDDLPAVLDKAGISFTDAEGRLRPLDEIIRDLEPHADDAGLMLDIFGDKAGPAMAALVSQGSEALTELTEDLHNSGGRAKEVADIQMQGLTGAMNLFKSASEAVLIAIAESGLLEAATSLITTIAGWIQKISEVNPLFIRIATVIGGVVAALGPILWAIGSFAGAISNILPLLKLMGPAITVVKIAFAGLTWPIGLIIAAIAALVYVFATDFMGIRTKTLEAWEAVKNAFTSAYNWIRDTFANIGDSMRSAWENIKSVFSGGSDYVKRIFTGMKDTLNSVIRVITSLFKGDFAGAWDAAKDVITGWWDTINAFLGGIPQKFLDFGRNMISGLIDGIKSMITGAVDAVKDVGNRVVDGFKGLLGIESPSTVFYDFGMNIGDGLADGIDDSTSIAVAAMNRMGQAVAAAGKEIQASASGALTPDNIIGGITKGLDGPEARQAINDRIAQLQKQRTHTKAHGGSIGASNYAAAMIDKQLESLEAELRRLGSGLKVASKEQEVQTNRFSSAVGKFDGGVRGYSLATQRY